MLVYRQALNAARDIDQIEEIAKHLTEKLEQELDLPRHFGFLMHWKVIAPFDNTERKKKKANERLREVSAEYKTLKTQLEARRQQSQVSAETDALGLEESSTPPFINEVNLSDLEKQQ